MTFSVPKFVAFVEMICATFKCSTLYIIHSFITLLPVLQQRLFQSKFSIEGDLVLPLSISSTLSFPEDHPVAAYVSLLVFLSLLSFPLSFLQNEEILYII
jgi:hypothetical protein